MRKMIFFAMTMLMAVSLNAQQSAGNRQQSMQRIEQQVRHYSEAFALSEEQARQFATLYKAYSKEMIGIRNGFHSGEQGKGTREELTEKRILQNFKQSRAILDTREKYYKAFRKVLKPSQINTIFEDEKARRKQFRQ